MCKGPKKTLLQDFRHAEFISASHIDPETSSG